MNAIKAEMDINRQRIGKTNIFTVQQNHFGFQNSQKTIYSGASAHEIYLASVRKFAQF